MKEIIIIHLESMNNIYNVGLYIRLSREDDDKNYESESITNQKSLLLQYARENNLRVYDIYIDDGFSGTNFDRPGFIRLIKDIMDDCCKKLQRHKFKITERIDFNITFMFPKEYKSKKKILYNDICAIMESYIPNKSIM